MENLPVEYDAKDQVYDLLRTIEAEMPLVEPVTEPAQLVAAGACLTQIKGWAKRIDEFRRSITRPMDDQKKRVLEFFEPYTAKLVSAECGLKRAMLDYNAEQERQRREQQAKLDAQLKAERERLEAEQFEAAMSGQTEQAELLQVKSQELANVVAVVPEVVQKIKGVSGRTVWRARVVDFAKLDDQYKLANQTALDGIARAMKGPSSIAGVEFYSEEIIAAGGR